MGIDLNESMETDSDDRTWGVRVSRVYNSGRGGGTSLVKNKMKEGLKCQDETLRLEIPGAV